MNFLANARALDEHRRFFRRVGEACQLHSKRRLLCERYQKLAACYVRGVTAEAQNEETDIARPKHQRIHHYADITLTAVEGERSRPDVQAFLVDIEVYGPLL